MIKRHRLPERRVHGWHYHYPNGHHSRRFGVGLVLPAIFITSAYYYTGYAALGLAAPPPHYNWVRYGPDLLLVETRTDTTKDVRYGVFEE